METFPRYWPFVRGIHRSPVNSPHKDQWLGALMFSLICAWINSWVNNPDAGDLRRHRIHYGAVVILMTSLPHGKPSTRSTPSSWSMRPLACSELINAFIEKRLVDYWKIESWLWLLNTDTCVIGHRDVVRWTSWTLKHFIKWWCYRTSKPLLSPLVKKYEAFKHIGAIVLKLLKMSVTTLS